MLEKTLRYLGKDTLGSRLIVFGVVFFLFSRLYFIPRIGDIGAGLSGTVGLFHTILIVLCFATFTIRKGMLYFLKVPKGVWKAIAFETALLLVVVAFEFAFYAEIGKIIGFEFHATIVSVHFLAGFFHGLIILRTQKSDVPQIEST